MGLTQIQIIQSLAEAMNWLERELAWGVPATELKHLTSRIGELYVAMTTNGQMATEVNQEGYDVVSAGGDRISVKTTAQSGQGGHVSFNRSTLGKVDRVVILRLNIEEMQVETLFNGTIAEAKALMTGTNIALSKLQPSQRRSRGKALKTLARVDRNGLTIAELENGSIEVKEHGKQVKAMPILKRMAAELGIPIHHASGGPKNSRSLGYDVMRALAQ